MKRPEITYRADRAYWRDRAREIAPNLSARETIGAAHLLAALYASDADEIAKIDAGGSGFDPSAGAGSAGKVRELSAVWHRLAPADIAQRALALALDRPSDGDTPTPTPAPDPYIGVRHQVVSKRSNSGRTAKRVTRAGVAIVMGDPIRMPERYIVRARGWRTSPERLALGCSTRPRSWRVLIAGEISPSLALPSPLETVRRRGKGANALAVMAITNRAYSLPAISDLREWSEITPELPEASAAGIAEHRADLSGNRGSLAMPLGRSGAPITPETARRSPAPRLTVGRAPILRASERHLASARALPAPADDPAEIWIGHTLYERGEYARPLPSERSQRVTLSAGDTSPDNIGALEAMVRLLNRGEALRGTTATGRRWAITRANDQRGRYAYSYRGKRSQRRTVEAITRALYIATISAD